MKLLFLLFPLISLGQNVGINTTTPTARFEVNGNVKIRASIGTVNDTVLVIRNNEILKVPASYYYTPQTDCPELVVNQSNGYYLLFKSTSSIPNPNATVTINGKTFVSAGSWISNNEYFFSYTNTSGSALNIAEGFSLWGCGY